MPKDLFGYTARFAHPVGRTRMDLVIGDWGEDTGGCVNNGALILLRGAAAGIAADHSQMFDPTHLSGGAPDFAKAGTHVS